MDYSQSSMDVSISPYYAWRWLFLPLNCWSRNWFNLGAQPTEIDLHAQTRRLTTGGASSSFEMIISQSKSHGDITRVFIAIRPLLEIERWSSCEIRVCKIIRLCMGIFTIALSNKKKCSQILNKNTSPYFHRASLAIWPFITLKRTHFSELSISRLTAYIIEASLWFDARAY